MSNKTRILFQCRKIRKFICSRLFFLRNRRETSLILVSKNRTVSRRMRSCIYTPATSRVMSLFRQQAIVLGCAEKIIVSYNKYTQLYCGNTIYTVVL